MIIRRCLALLSIPCAVLLPLSQQGCSGEGKSEDETEDIEYDPDVATFRVNWKDETFVIPEADSEEFVLTYEPFSGVLVFDDAFPALQDVHASEFLVVEGVGVFKIVETEGGRVVVEPASLPEVAHDGAMTWDVGFNPGSTEAAEQWDIHANPDWELASTSLNFSGTLGQAKLDLKVEPQHPDRHNVSLSLAAPASSPTGTMNANGWVKEFRVKGDYEFSDGKVDRFTLWLEGLEIEANISLKANGPYESPFLKAPASLTVPFNLPGLPVPMFISIGGAAEIRSIIDQDFGAEADIKVNFKGLPKIEWKDGALTDASTLDRLQIVPKGSDIDTTVGAGIGTLIDFPRVDFGFGSTSRLGGIDLNASVFTKFKSEVVFNKYVDINLFTGERRSCQVLRGAAGAYWGGSLRILGFTIEEETEIWFDERSTQEGPDCDDVLN